MSAPRTRSQIGRSNRAKGATAERDLARWLRSNGYPEAERAVVTGFRTAERVSADLGDIRGTPGMVWSVKDCERERQAEWRVELDAMQAAHPDQNAVGLLVHKRRGHADPGGWWCWIHITDLTRVLPGPTVTGYQWFRATVSEVLDLVARHGEAP